MKKMTKFPCVSIKLSVSCEPKWERAREIETPCAPSQAQFDWVCSCVHEIAALFWWLSSHCVNSSVFHQHWNETQFPVTFFLLLWIGSGKLTKVILEKTRTTNKCTRPIQNRFDWSFSIKSCLECQYFCNFLKKKTQMNFLMRSTDAVGHMAKIRSEHKQQVSWIDNHVFVKFLISKQNPIQKSFFTFFFFIFKRIDV